MDVEERMEVWRRVEDGRKKERKNGGRKEGRKIWCETVRVPPTGRPCVVDSTLIRTSTRHAV